MQISVFSYCPTLRAFNLGEFKRHMATILSLKFCSWEMEIESMRMLRTQSGLRMERKTKMALGSRKCSWQELS